MTPKVPADNERKGKTERERNNIPIEDFWTLDNAIPKSVHKILVRIITENTILKKLSGAFTKKSAKVARSQGKNFWDCHI
jgi:hypothetical protein